MVSIYLRVINSDCYPNREAITNGDPYLNRDTITLIDNGRPEASTHKYEIAIGDRYQAIPYSYRTMVVRLHIQRLFSVQGF
jgi:hypothetical protein